MGEMLHDPSLSPEKFSQIIRTRTSVSLGPLSHITDSGDVSDPDFLAKLSALLTKADAAEVETAILRLVRQESLVLKSEFKMHRAMLEMLLSATCNFRVLKRGAKAAANIGSSDVASILLHRLREVAPGVAAQVVSEITKKLSQSSLALEDRLDEELDARLAVLEDEPTTDDEDFVVDDSDNDVAAQDEEYEPPSGSSSDNDEAEDDDDDDDDDDESSTVVSDEE